MKNQFYPTQVGEKGSGIGRSDKSIQDFETIRDDCLQNKILFKDPDFPADESSLQMKGESRQFKWLRPTVEFIHLFE